MSYSLKVFGDGHSNDRTITDDTLAFHERWEVYMRKRYEDGVWSRDYWPPDADLATKAGPPLRKKGDTLWSIAFGHAEGGDNPPYVITEDMEFSRQEARDLLRRDIEPKARWVNARIKTDLTTYMFGAIVSLAYQFGQGRLDAAQKGEHVDGSPLIVELKRGYPADGQGGFQAYRERIHMAFPFIELLNNGKYIEAALVIRDMGFKKDGSAHNGLLVRRDSEIGFYMTRREKEV